MNEDGSRRWIRPKPSDGAWFTRRRIVAYLLMVVYVAIPHIDINGKPVISTLKIPGMDAFYLCKGNLRYYKAIITSSRRITLMPTSNKSRC